MAHTILEIKNLRVQYVVDRVITHAINGIDLVLSKGETLGLVGETGAGKTTLAKTIMRLIPSPPGKIVEGGIFYEGEDLLKKSKSEMSKIRGREISMVFQDPMTALNPVMSVGDQIMEVIQLHQNSSKKEATIKAQEMMELVGIECERYNDLPHQFSGGMKQRIVIAIALACNPSLLIADEPTTALDVTIQAQVLELMTKLKNEFDTSLILITHDLGVVVEVCSKVAIMYAGRIAEYGTLEQIFNETTHPYTLGLFGSIPSFDEHVRRLKPINGLMPDPTNLPDGCSFAPRCLGVMSKCHSGNVPIIDVGDGHLVECWKFYKKGGG